MSAVWLGVLTAALTLPYSHGVSAAVGSAPHVMVVLMENSSYEGIVGNTQMPYVNGLIASNGSVSTTDLSHPSEPNYLGLVSGSIQDNPQDLTPQDETYAGPEFTDELAAAGIGWKAYMQDMPVACDLTDHEYDVRAARPVGELALLRPEGHPVGRCEGDGKVDLIAINNLSIWVEQSTGVAFSAPAQWLSGTP